MKLCFFVHECFLEAGHTRAMLEVIRAMPSNRIDELHLVYFEGGQTKELLPEFSGKVIHHKVPFKWLFPFLAKAIFYQIYCFFLIRFVLPVDSKKVGIGTACLNVDISNVQFVQTQWKPLYFKNKFLLSPRVLYKCLLFYYFELCENYLYRKPDLQISSLSQFVTDYLKTNFQIPDTNIKTLYSSSNLEHFPMPALSRSDAHALLSSEYPILEKLNIDKPIYLFVGAYERKGLFTALERLKIIKDSQIIVIGKPESGRTIQFEESPKVFPISFTKKLKTFYELTDVFIFPTIYEPFGLVISEAAAMGNLVLVPYKNVGASEILKGLKSIIFTDKEVVDLQKIEPLSLQEKQKNAIEVRARLSHYSWEKAARGFLELTN